MDYIYSKWIYLEAQDKLENFQVPEFGQNYYFILYSVLTLVEPAVK